VCYTGRNKGGTLKNYLFKVVVEEDIFPDGRKGFSAYCPELEGAYTWGATKEEALDRIREAIKLIIDELLEEGKGIPSEALICATEFNTL
jgi:predicted RNase H-like HicB family nuclease